MLAFDKSMRRTDENGFLHVEKSHITKATVNPYRGNEVPDWKERGLDPNKVYYGLRDPEELQKSLGTWAGLPLHLRHHEDSADDPQKMTRVGSVGTAVVWDAPYVDAPLTVLDRKAIDAIERGTCKELSCAYRYDPDWTPGTYEGMPYDFVMRNIRGNHVALVEEGRAGSDVCVADSMPQNLKSQGGLQMSEETKTTAADNEAVEQKEVDLAQAIIDLHKVDPVTGKIVDADDSAEEAAVRSAMDDIAKTLDPALAARLKDAITKLAAVASGGADDEEAAPAPAPEDPVKAAIDACGLDSGDEIVKKAFEAGVQYAAAKAENEAAPAEDEDANKASDEEAQVEPTGAQDSKMKTTTTQGMAMDAATIRRQAVQDTKRHMQELFTAVETVRPLVGAVKPMSFDSANDVYKHALKAKGLNPDQYEPAAWRGMVDVMLRQQTGAVRSFAQDSAPAEFTGPFADLKNIVIS